MNKQLNIELFLHFLFRTMRGKKKKFGLELSEADFNKVVGFLVKW